MDLVADIRYKIFPHINLEETFKSVYTHLGHRRGVVGIFPEGGSHDQTRLLELKVGSAIMALGTLKRYPVSERREREREREMSTGVEFFLISVVFADCFWCVENGCGCLELFFGWPSCHLSTPHSPPDLFGCVYRLQPQQTRT